MFTPVTIRRRSAAQGCADAQHSPRKAASSRRVNGARSHEQLAGSRASQKHCCEAAGTRAAAAEAAAAGGGGGSSSRGRRAMWSARNADACFSSFGCSLSMPSFCKIFSKTGVLAQNFRACGAPKKGAGLAALADPGPPPYQAPPSPPEGWSLSRARGQTAPQVPEAG